VNSPFHRNLSLGLVALCFVASAVSYTFLPERIPIHWNFRGEIDGWGSRWTVFLMPTVMLLLIGVFGFILVGKPAEDQNAMNKLVYGRLMLVMTGLFAFIQAMILWSTFQRDLSSRILIAGICLFLGLLGNQLGKVDRNALVGVRTPWTLASDRVWIATHRLAAWMAVAFAALGFVIALIPGAPPWLAFIVVMAGFIYPAIHSYILHQRFAREGTL
jgi:uncharacterized membrane protein